MLRQSVVALAVIVYAAHNDPAGVRLTLRVPHDAEPVRKAVDAAQMVHDRPRRSSGLGGADVLVEAEPVDGIVVRLNGG